MSAARAFLRDTRAGGAAEFTLVLPIMLILLFGIIDVGRFAWDMNQLGKAVQVGARWAVVTDAIPDGLNDSNANAYSWASDGGIAQGSVVPSGSFSGIYCTGTSSTATCSWKGSTPSGFSSSYNAAAFRRLVDRMKQIDPDIDYANVRVDYDYSGLGFAGDPNGPDVVPLTKVTVRNLQFKPITTFLFKTNITFPDISYSLTMEDGSGSASS